jgi:2'-5' RNA ligase
MFDDGAGIIWGPDGSPAKVVIPEVDLPVGRAVGRAAGHAEIPEADGPGTVLIHVEVEPVDGDGEPELPTAKQVDRSDVPGWPDAEGEKPCQTMVALRVPPKVGGRYGRDGAAIVDLLPLQERHITVIYLGEQSKCERERLHDAVRRWMVATEWQIMDGTAQGWGTFNPSDGESRNVLWMSWDIPGLAEMRQDLKEYLQGENFEWDDDHDFTPHETVGYTDGPIHSLPEFPKLPVNHTFDGLVVAEDDVWTEYPFQRAVVFASGRAAVVAALEAAADAEVAAMSDAQLEALIAAGGADRNRGNAEKLRRYWTVGKGGAKIRWNTKGDYERCVRHLSKHLGPRAKGYCQNRHKEMTGLYTGDMKHRIMYGWGGKPGSYWAKVAAKKGVAASGGVPIVVPMGEKAAPVTDDPSNPLMMMLNGEAPKQQKFRIPLLLPEGVESGDGRTFKTGVVEARDMPLPLLWQPNSMQGHDGAMIVGRIDSVERVEGGLGNARGVFDTSPVALEAVRMIKNGFLRGASADLDQFEAKILGKGEGTSTAGKKSTKKGDNVVAPDKMVIERGRVMGATLVAKPAFEQVRIELVEDDVETDKEDALVQEEGAPLTASASLPDGVYRGSLPDSVRHDAAVFVAGLRRSGGDGSVATFAALVASGGDGGLNIPIAPPGSWFENPNLSKPTHLSITDEGRVFGHIAAWHVDHIGMGFGTRPPKSKSNYSYFRTGMLRTAEGNDIRVGQITLTGGHAALSADARSAVKHYDDTMSAFADVVAGEDQHGIWVAGALRPEVTAGQLRAARASSPSGDWRPINGKLELVAVCQVNVPGFPVVEARVASGEVVALVAAGTVPLVASLVASTAPAGEPEQEPVAAAATELSKADLVRQRREEILAKREAAAAELAAQQMQEQQLEEQFLSAKARLLRARVGDIEPVVADAGSNLEEAVRGLTVKEAAELLFAAQEEAAAAEAAEMEAITAAAARGEALSDGSWWIENVEDLMAAVEEFGTCETSRERRIVKNHIKRRARDMGAYGYVPPWWWTERELSAIEDEITDMVIDEAVEMAIDEAIGSELAALAVDGSEAAALTTEDESSLESVTPAELSVGVPAEAEFSKQPVSAARREKMAAEKTALPDGSYPIADAADLRRAISSYGRSKKADRKKVREHIIRRAKALGKQDMIPASWNER